MRMQKNVLLKNYNTTGVGGPAKYFCSVTSTEKLVEAVNWALKQKLSYFILGGGSNVLISDEGFPGLVIKNNIKGIVGFKQLIKVGTGTLLSQLIVITVRQKLAGLQKLAGIPGTVGGAVYGNAGAYGEAIGNMIIKVVCFDPQKNMVVSLTRKQCQFGYRDSVFKNSSYIILEAHFKLSRLPGQALEAQMKEVLKERGAKNYWEGKNPGSFFKNIMAADLLATVLKNIPPDKINYGKISAGYLLETVGAKEMKEGKVRVSQTHANLLVNTGGGSAADFIKLAKQLQKKVKAKFSITLQPEVQLINLPPLQTD